MKGTPPLYNCCTTQLQLFMISRKSRNLNKKQHHLTLARVAGWIPPVRTQSAIVGLVVHPILCILPATMAVLGVHEPWMADRFCRIKGRLEAANSWSLGVGSYVHTSTDYRPKGGNRYKVVFSPTSGSLAVVDIRFTIFSRCLIMMVNLKQFSAPDGSRRNRRQYPFLCV